MNCKKCGSPLPEGSLFCGVCGERVTAESAAPSGGFFSTAGGLDGSGGRPVPQTPQGRPQGVSGLSGSLVNGGQNAQKRPVQPDQPVQPVQPPVQPVQQVRPPEPPIQTVQPPVAYCANCGAPMEAGSKFCGVCGAPVAGAGPALIDDLRPLLPNPRAKKPKKKLLIIGAAALSVLLVVGIVLGIIVQSVANGPVAKLYTSVRNTLNASSFSGEIYCSNSYGDRERFSFEAAISPKHEEVSAVISIDGSKVAIYDGYLLEKEGDYVYKEDISEILDQIFEAYNSTKSNLSDTDLRKVIRDADPSGELYDIVSETVDLDKLEDCFKTLIKRLNDESWLKENAGFVKNKHGKQTTYSFEIGTRFLRAIAEILRPAFHSSEEYYDAMGDYDFMDREGISVEASYTVEGKYLVSASFTVNESRSYGVKTFNYGIDFTNIGHTQIDTDQLEYWLSIAE